MISDTVKTQQGAVAMKIARIYLRVSTEQQDLDRQRVLVDQARAQGYYVAGIYEDKASGIKSDRDGLQRMIADLQPGDVVIAEKIDRISRAPLREAEAIIQAIKDKGAKLVIPGIVDLSDIEAEGMARIVLDAMQDMLLKIAMQMARDDWETRQSRVMQGVNKAKAEGKYKGRPVNQELHRRIRSMLLNGETIRGIARDVKTDNGKPCSTNTVIKIRAQMIEEGLLPAR
jgi:DNA invertase Pin-like site-specific DNA recombinase